MEIGLSEPLLIWAVSDGRVGMENQALGLAEAVARLTPARIVVKRVRWRPVFDRLPSALKSSWMLDPASDPVRPAAGEPWPHLWIATGRATLPLSVEIKRRSGGAVYTVQTQDPRWRIGDYDLVVAPAHDGLVGPNVLPIVGSPHRLSPQGLAQAAEAFRDRLEPLPSPRVAVLIGGRSAAFDLPPSHAEALGRSIARAVSEAGGSVLVTFSRRTPEDARRVLREALGSLPGLIWDGEGPNPYFAFLKFADHVLVTGDSANMAAEAASTGKPVQILPMVPLKPAPKFERLHATLRDRGAARPFSENLDAWTYAPLSETDRAAAEVLRRMRDRG